MELQWTEVYEFSFESDVWLGAGVRMLRNVTIGRGSVVGAGSVVTKSLPPYSVAVGVPARVIKTRTHGEVENGPEGQL